MKKFILAILMPVVFVIASCAGDTSSGTYETNAANRVNSANTGTVLAIRKVIVKTSNGSVGSTAGAVAGGAAGSMIGGSTAVNVIGAVGGAVLGGMAGGKTQEALSKQEALEYIVKLDNGRVVTITQGLDNRIQEGERCIVLDGGSNKARVIPY